MILQCSGSEIIYYGSASSIGKSRIPVPDPDPDPGNHPITDPDPIFELEIVFKKPKFCKNLKKNSFSDINVFLYTY